MNFCWNALAPQIRRRKRKHLVGTHETWPYFGLTLEEASHAVRVTVYDDIFRIGKDVTEDNQRRWVRGMALN
ncbi:hypothetical protein Tco_1367630 [Tanacetum coccineum]